MKFFQKEIKLQPYNRGFHLITDSVLDAIPEIKQIDIGYLQVFIKHTSASLTINENADFTVRGDFERHFNKMVPEMHHITSILLKVQMICLHILKHRF